MKRAIDGSSPVRETGELNFFESEAGYRAPLKDDIEGKSVSVSLVLLTNASRMEELRNLWNDARVVTAGIWRVPPSNRESRSLKQPKNT